MTRETTEVKEAPQSIKLVYSGSGTDVLSHGLLDNAAQAAYLASKPFSWGCWMKSNTASAWFQLGDGVGETQSAHSGGNTWEWITGTHTMNASPTAMAFAIKQNGSGTTYVGPVTLVAGPIPPQAHIPSHSQIAAWGYQIAGDPPATGIVCHLGHNRPFMVKHVFVDCNTQNNTTTPLKFDIYRNYSGQFYSIFLTGGRPTISTGQNRVGAVPSNSVTATGTTFAGSLHNTVFTQTDTSPKEPSMNRLRIACTQTATATGVENPTVLIRCLSFPHPLEAYRGNDHK
jgi:hypothetical protein